MIKETTGGSGCQSSGSAFDTNVQMALGKSPHHLRSLNLCCFPPPVACLTCLHQHVCVLLSTTTKMPEQLKLASFLALGLWWNHLPYFLLSLGKKSSVPQKKTKNNNENLCLSLPVGGAKNYPDFHCMCCLTRQRADPTLLQQQNKEIPLLRFVTKAFLGSGFLVPRWKCLLPAYHSTSAQSITIYKEA